MTLHYCSHWLEAFQTFAAHVPYIMRSANDDTGHAESSKSLVLLGPT